MRHHGHRPHHVHAGHGTTINVNKTGTSVTQKLGGGLTVTTGSSGTTVTRTTGGNPSVTTQTRNGSTSTRVNQPRKWFGLF